MIFAHNIDTPIGEMLLRGSGEAVTELRFGHAECEVPSQLLSEAEKQLREYFDGERREFDLPLEPEGTEFQKKVWDALRGIAYSEAKSYGEVAADIGNPKAARAVGMACNRNPIAIIIPCHRVVGADGRLTGYAGGLDKKEFLLEHERRMCL